MTDYQFGFLVGFIVCGALCIVIGAWVAKG